MKNNSQLPALLGQPFWKGIFYMTAIVALSANLLVSCFKDPYPRKECQACEETIDCCCGLTCRDFIIQGGSLNGLPVKRCASASTTTCPN